MKRSTISLLATGTIFVAGYATYKTVDAHPNHPPVPVLQITTDFTWSEHVRPIFRAKCMSCHSPAGIVPAEFYMTTYAATENGSGVRERV